MRLEGIEMQLASLLEKVSETDLAAPLEPIEESFKGFQS